MEIKLEDKYKLSKGTRFLTGAQALVRVPIVQARRDKQKNLKFFNNPAPAREISLIYSKSKLKLPIIYSLNKVISGIIKGKIMFENVKIVSPK